MELHDSAYHLTTHHPQDEEKAADINQGEKSEHMSADMSSCPVAEELVFSSLDTHFSIAVFFEQFIFHIFFPFTAPYMWYKYGMKHIQIQQYSPDRVGSYTTTYIPFLCIMAIFLCWRAEPEILSLEQWVLPIGGFILQRMMIAVKYASLSPDEYKAFMSIGASGFFTKLSRKDREKSSRFMSNMQIVSGWIVIPDALIKHELVVSSILQGIDMSDLYFYIPLNSSCLTRESNPERMYNNWMRLYEEPESEYNLKRERSSSTVNNMTEMYTYDNWKKSKDGKYLQVNCMDVCEYIFHVFNKRVQGYMKYTYLFTFFMAALLVYTYWSEYSHVFKYSIYTKVYFVASVYVMSFFFPVILLFCMVVLVDIHRRYEVSRMLKELISVSDVKMVDTRLYQKSFGKKRKDAAVQLQACAFNQKSSLRSFGQFVLPRIDMSMPTNYIAWCMCRQVLVGFGNRFLFRTNLYMVVLALLVVVQVANTVYDMLFSSLSNDEICGSYSFSTAVITMGFTAALLCLLMTGIHMTNRRMKKHRIQLTTHLLHANKALHELLFSSSIGMECEKTSGSNLKKAMNNGHHKTMIPKHPVLRRDSDGEGVDTNRYSYNFHNGDKNEAILQLRECIESANAVVQTVVEFDEVQQLKIMNLHVEKEYIFTLVSSVFLYSVILYSFCDDGMNFSSS